MRTRKKRKNRKKLRKTSFAKGTNREKTEKTVKNTHQKMTKHKEWYIRKIMKRRRTKKKR